MWEVGPNGMSDGGRERKCTNVIRSGAGSFSARFFGHSHSEQREPPRNMIDSGIQSRIVGQRQHPEVSGIRRPISLS